ncbi:MAG: helix-turn-helix domain-containing protein [Gemmatimonadales bacterium]
MPTSAEVAGDILRAARTRAGLTQRGLAARAGTAQSVVARIEGHQVSPTWETLVRLLAAAGFELRPRVDPLPAEDSHMLSDVRRILALTPESRLIELRNVSQFVAAARRA